MGDTRERGWNAPSAGLANDFKLRLNHMMLLCWLSAWCTVVIHIISFMHYDSKVDLIIIS